MARLVAGFYGGCSSLHVMVLRFFSSIGNAASQPYIQEIVTHDKIGRYHGMTRAFWGFFGVILLWISLFILGKEPHLSDYFVLFSFLLLWNILSLFFIKRLPDTGIRGEEPKCLASMRSLFNDSTFRKLCLFTLATFFLIGFTRPYEVAYLARINYGANHILMLTSLWTLGSLIGSITAGFIVDRGRASSLLILCAITMLGSGFLWLLVKPYNLLGWPDYVPLVTLFLIRGFFAGAFNLVEVFILFSLAPKKGDATIYMGVNRMVLPLGFGLAPILGGILVDGLQQTQFLFFSGHALNHYEFLFMLNGLLYIPVMLLGLYLCRALQKKIISVKSAPFYFE